VPEAWLESKALDVGVKEAGERARVHLPEFGQPYGNKTATLRRLRTCVCASPPTKSSDKMRENLFAFEVRMNNLEG
jgi:hypothetical protein